MKQKFLACVLTLSMVSRCTYPFPDIRYNSDNSTITPHTSATEQILDFFIFEFLVEGDVSPNVLSFVRHLQDELDMSHLNIRVKKMSSLFMKQIGKKNSVASSLGNILIISEEWFHSLNDEEQRMLIGHELIHIKQRHDVKSIATSVIVLTLLNLLYTVQPIKYFDKHYNISLTIALKVHTPLFQYIYKERLLDLITPLLLYLLRAYARHNEREADIIAASSLHCASGGVSLFSQIRNEITDGEQQSVSNFRLKRIFYALQKLGKRLFSSHPSLDERIAYLQKIARLQHYENRNFLC